MRLLFIVWFAILAGWSMGLTVDWWRMGMRKNAVRCAFLATACVCFMVLSWWKA